MEGAMVTRNCELSPYAALLIAGAVIGLVANGMHPHSATGDRSVALRSVAESETWVAIHLGIIVAVLLVTGGLVGLAALLSEGAGRALARLGLTAGVTGCAVIMVSTAVDGFAMKPLAEEWVGSAGEESALLAVAIAADHIDFAIWTVGMFIYFGLAFVCIGLSMVVSRTFPAFGWIAAASGSGSAFAALTQTVAMGESALAEAVFLGSSMLITMWAFSVGVLMWRHVDHRAIGGRPVS